MNFRTFSSLYKIIGLTNTLHKRTFYFTFKRQLLNFLWSLTVKKLILKRLHFKNANVFKEWLIKDRIGAKK
jgi:hypothetical protein